jgi:hypothetical protein
MSFKNVVIVWFVFMGVLGSEYYALHFNESLSIVKKLQLMGIIPSRFSFKNDPGSQPYYLFGWIGLTLMIIMNLYSIRKRASWMSNMGKLQSWLNFHILCGLLGPTFILFHCNFKVRGIVGISFWSMVVSFSSGLIGRYFYIQLLSSKNDYDDLADQSSTNFDKYMEKMKIQVKPEEKQLYLAKALEFVGAPQDASALNAVKALFVSMAGDIRLWFKEPEIQSGWPDVTRIFIKNYALNKRRSVLLLPFQRLMGYWHAFHFPFAVFMYVAAVIHVIAAILLGV